ncbi:hypothetical protein [Streptomyces sp. NPDC052036]|uniref:hypothetical protein n=1 Tax=Streptomyces sp. NPDC052036 TaxID=3155171 RepID=UPI003448F05F
MAYDVGDQLGHAQLGGIGQLRHLPFTQERAGDTPDVPRRVLTDGETHAVLGGAGL